MLGIGVQTHNVVNDDNPMKGYERLKRCGFTNCDFSLNMYLSNKEIYNGRKNDFFDKDMNELESLFLSHKEAAKASGICINQMHMPYPIYVPKADLEFNNYLVDTIAVKSMEIGRILECKNIVIHGMKLANYLGSEEAEWAMTEKFIHKIAPIAREYKMTICIENLYNSVGTHLVEGPCCNARKAAERIDRINDYYKAEVLGFCFDTGHANLVGIDFEDFITTLGSRLKVLHIHDNDGVRDLHQMPYTFTMARENNPSTDWDGFVRGLKKICFDGVLSFETAPILQSFPAELGDNALSMIADIGKYFKEQIEMQ